MAAKLRIAARGSFVLTGAATGRPGGGVCRIIDGVGTSPIPAWLGIGSSVGILGGIVLALCAVGWRNWAVHAVELTGASVVLGGVCPEFIEAFRLVETPTASGIALKQSIFTPRDLTKPPDYRATNRWLGVGGIIAGITTFVLYYLGRYVDDFVKVGDWRPLGFLFLGSGAVLLLHSLFSRSKDAPAGTLPSANRDNSFTQPKLGSSDTAVTTPSTNPPGRDRTKHPDSVTDQGPPG